MAEVGGSSSAPSRREIVSKDDDTEMLALLCKQRGHVRGASDGDAPCKICTAIAAEQRRIRTRHDQLSTSGKKIEFLLRALRKIRTMDQEGRIQTIREPNVGRGNNAKNLVRLLRKKENIRRIVQAAGGGKKIKMPRLPSSWSDHENYIKASNPQAYPSAPKTPRGRAGRAARSKNKSTLQQRARELHRQGLTQLEIGKKLDRCERMVRYYLKR